MKKLTLISAIVMINQVSVAQSINKEILLNKPRAEFIRQLETDDKITAQMALNQIHQFNKYEKINETGKEYILTIEDKVFGKVPFRLFIPKGYNPAVKNPMALLLHGAVGESNFQRAYDTRTKIHDIFFDALAKQNYIIIRPFADPSKKFDWAINRFEDFGESGSASKNNETYRTLVEMVNYCKSFLNVNDQKVFSYGHSDGADGTFLLQLGYPTPFAGFVCYNSMLTNIFAKNVYLNNAVNRPLFLVHSDRDDLRPIEQIRVIRKTLTESGSPVSYKEYLGYQHYDKHLDKDIPNSISFLNTTTRNAFKKTIRWETGNYMNTTCDWIAIRKFDTKKPGAPFHKPIAMQSYNKKSKKWDTIPYYNNEESSMIKAELKGNTFYVETSRVNEFDIFISPAMVNTDENIKVVLNNKVVFDKKIPYNKAFMVKNFKTNTDRELVWVNYISLKVN